MKTSRARPAKDNIGPVAQAAPRRQDNQASGLRFRDSRGSVAAQARLQRMAASNTRSNRQMQLQQFADNHAGQRPPPASAQAAKSGLPKRLKAGIESLSGIAMDDVEVHYNSSQPAQLQALAYARGSDIYLAAGQEKQLPHEAWHVVQQKQGRVRPSRLAGSGIEINTDAGLEKEADQMGYRASMQYSLDPGSARFTNYAAAVSPGQTCIQAKLGFELEWLTFVDLGGHRVPEKTKLGSYGKHLNLDVDESNVGTLAEPAPENIYSLWSDARGRYYFYDKSTKTSTWNDPGGTHKPYPSIVEVVTKPYAPETKSGRASIRASIEEARALADAIQDGKPRRPMKNVPGLKPALRHLNIGHDQWGSTDASIQTTFGMDLAQLGALIESLDTELSLRSQFRMKHHSDTEGVLKADDETLRAMGETALVGKQQSDMPSRSEGDRVRAELAKSIANARAIIDALVDKLASDGKIRDNRKAYWKGHLHNLEGLLICVCQYLQMGRYFYFPDVVEDDSSSDLGKMKKDASDNPIWRKMLDKNVVAMMSRTDMALMYRELVPAAEKKMDCRRGEVTAALIPLLLSRTGRDGAKALFNDPTESMGKTDTDFDWMPSCQDFVHAIFNSDTDGVTPNFGEIQQMGPEKIDPGAWKKTVSSKGKVKYSRPWRFSKTSKPADYKEGAVFELRNLIPRGGGRFPKSQWLMLAEHITKCLAQLNARDENSQDKVNPKWASKGESWEEALK